MPRRSSIQENNQDSFGRMPIIFIEVPKYLGKGAPPGKVFRYVKCGDGCLEPVQREAYQGLKGIETGPELTEAPQ